MPETAVAPVTAPSAAPSPSPAPAASPFTTPPPMSGKTTQQAMDEAALDDMDGPDKPAAAPAPARRQKAARPTGRASPPVPSPPAPLPQPPGPPRQRPAPGAPAPLATAGAPARPTPPPSCPRPPRRFAADSQSPAPVPAPQGLPAPRRPAKRPRHPASKSRQDRPTSWTSPPHWARRSPSRCLGENPRSRLPTAPPAAAPRPPGFRPASQSPPPQAPQ